MWKRTLNMVLVSAIVAVVMINLCVTPALAVFKETGLQEGKQAPDFELKDMSGKTVKLSDYKGKVVFLNFWATWCYYCVEEMPLLNETGKELAEKGDGIIITVDIEEDKDTVEKYMAFNGLNLPVLLDYSGEVANAYGVSGIPSTYIIDEDGILRGNIVGAIRDKNAILGSKLLDKVNYKPTQNKVEIDGVILNEDASPVIVDGRLLVPFRAIFEAIGGNVEWDATERAIKCDKNGVSIKLQIENKAAIVNDREVTMDVPAKIINNRTFVPVRFIAENLGLKVEWDKNRNTAVITTK